MNHNFFENSRTVWGFKLPHKGNPSIYLDQHKAETVQMVVEQAFRNGWEVNYLPQLLTPCIFIKTPESLIHYFLSEEDARRFRDDIMFGESYPFSLIKVAG
jgi:hypothetical protein